MRTTLATTFASIHQRVVFLGFCCIDRFAHIDMQSGESKLRNTLVEDVVCGPSSLRMLL